MRTLTLLAALLTPLLGVGATKSTVLVVPFTRAADTPEWTSNAFAEVLTDLVAQQNRDAFISLKQLDAVLRRRDLGLDDVAEVEVALPVARSLGATDVVLGEVRRLGAGYIVRAKRFVVGAPQDARRESVEFTLAELPQVAARLGQKLLDLDPKLPVLTGNSHALEWGMRCATDLIRLPLGPRAPSKLKLAFADDTEGACRDALQEDPNMGLAHAGLALVEYARGHKTEAMREAAASHATRFVAQGWLVESYLVRQGGDEAGARGVLAKALVERPGFLHALGYLGEDQLEDKDPTPALKTFDTYLERSPGHPWALAMKGKALARLGRHEEAIDATRAAVAKNPGDPELLIELASRLVDAGQIDAAEAPLAEALTAWPVRPNALLRMGWVKYKQNKLDPAKEFLTRTLSEAWREDEARTRGLAHVDLALVAASEGKAADVVAHLEAARAEGSPKKLPCADPAFAAFKADASFVKVCGGAK